MTSSREPVRLPDSSTVVTLEFDPWGDAETVRWTGSAPWVIAEIGRVRRWRLQVADMIADPATSDESTAIGRAHRLLANLTGCQVATASTDTGCVASWRDRCPGRFVDVAVEAGECDMTPLVAAALAFSRVAVGKSLPPGETWVVCVSRSGVTRRFVLRAVPLLG